MYLKKLMIRLNEIITIRSQHDELLRLLSKEEQEKFKVESLFDVFRDGKTFYISEQLTDSWVLCKQKYEDDLLKVETHVCDQLRKEIFAEQSATPTQRMREFQRWRGLMSKQSIKTVMKMERETLVGQMAEEMKMMAEDFDKKKRLSIDAIPHIEKPPQC